MTIDAAPYLSRIGLDAQVGPPSVDLLAALQLAHLVHVPFENLHVYHRREPRTDADWSVHKVVSLRRGGWCFELNGAFATLLRALGFSVDHVSCQVWEADRSEWGPDLDHLASIVHLDGERWFVDVGFGDCCLVPLPLQPGDHAAAPRPVRIEMDGRSVLLHELMPAEDEPGAWEPQLRVALTPRALAEFTPRSEHLYSDPDSTWHQKPFATRALDGAGSRITLRSTVIRRREASGPFRDERVAAGDWPALLWQHFALDDSFDRAAT